MQRRQALLQGSALDRTVRRMALELAERSSVDVPMVFLAVEGAGVHLAHRMATEIKQVFNRTVEVCEWQRTGIWPVQPVLDGVDAVIVDDVIFSGATLFRMLSATTGLAAARRVMIAALVDRGHRRYPLHADVVGITAPTKLDEHIDVVYSGQDAHVTLLQ